MKWKRFLVLFAALPLVCGGCRSGGQDDDIEPRACRSESDDVAVTEEPEAIADYRPVWRFPFVEIAIDPAHPRSVAVRVANEDEGRTYVDLDVNWDDADD